MNFSRYLAIATMLCAGALSLGPANAREVGVGRRFVDDRASFQVNVRAGIHTLVLQRKDVGSKVWVDHSFMSVQGPVKKFQVPVPEGYDRKTKWRFRGVMDDGGKNAEKSPSNVFPGVVLERFDLQYVTQPSEKPPVVQADSLWKVDKLKLVPGYLLRLDDAASKIVVTSDQDVKTVLSEKPLEGGRPVKFAVEGNRLYVLKVNGHTLVNNRVFDVSQTPNPVPMATYIWDIYDISALPAITLLSSTEFGLDVSTGIASLLREGGLDASIVFPKPGIAAVLINHTAWVSDKLSYLPEGIPPVHAGTPNTEATLVYRGYKGKDYGLSDSSYPAPGNSSQQVYKASQQRSCPVFVVADCRQPQSPQFSDPMLVGDQRTVRSTPLFSTDGAVAFGFETIESLASPMVRDSVRSYLQIFTVGENGAVSVNPVQDLPGRLQAMEEFTGQSALVWTSSFAAGNDAYSVNAQVSLYENYDVSLQSS